MLSRLALCVIILLMSMLLGGCGKDQPAPKYQPPTVHIDCTFPAPCAPEYRR